MVDPPIRRLGQKPSFDMFLTELLIAEFLDTFYNPFTTIDSDSLHYITLLSSIHSSVF